MQPETIPQPITIAGIFVRSVFCPGAQEADSHPVGSIFAEKLLLEEVGARSGTGILGRLWLRLDHSL